jgi:hypothetical protein
LDCTPSPASALSSTFRATEAEGSGGGDCRWHEGCQRRKGAAVRAAAVATVSSGGIGSGGARQLECVSCVRVLAA